MPLDSQQLIEPIRKLRKAIKRLPERPSTDQIHDLRTNSRRIAAIFDALGLDKKKGGHRLLREVELLRKRAGKVRDMDVQTGLAATLAAPCKQQRNDLTGNAVMLLEYLGERRFVAAKRLCRQVDLKGKKTREALERLIDSMEPHTKSATDEDIHDDVGLRDSAALALQLATALANWPRLNRNNLHAFRLKIKALRYTLDLSSDADRRLRHALGQTKDVIGEWHDWCELESQARRALKDENLGGHIHSIAERKLHEALGGAAELRQRYFGGAKADRRNRSSARPVDLKESILISAGRMSR